MSVQVYFFNESVRPWWGKQKRMDGWIDLLVFIIHVQFPLYMTDIQSVLKPLWLSLPPPSIRLFSLSSWALHFCLKQQILLLWVCYPCFNAKHATAVIRSGKLHWIKAYNHNQNYYVMYNKSIHIFYTTLHHPHINSPNCVKQKKKEKNIKVVGEANWQIHVYD